MPVKVWFRHCLFRVAAFVAALFALASGVSAAPALWKVEGDKGTLYVLGTMHRLPEGAEWFDEPLKALIAGSDALILETASSQAANDYLGLIASKPGVVFTKRPLDSLIDQETTSRLRQRLISFGAPVEKLNTFRPWYAALLLSVLSGADAGLEAKYGAETVIEAFAEAKGVPRVGLETAAFQILLFANLPRASEVEFLLSTLKETEDHRARAEALYQAWIGGDLATTETLVLGPFLGNPPLYEALITRRNRAWAKELEPYLRKEGTAVVAVGTGHLVGPDSLLLMLEAKGYRVERQ